MWLAFLDSTFERAVFWHDVANIALILSLLIGALATFVIVRTSATKEEYLKSDLANTNLRGEEARAEAARATEGAAIANERAAQAEAQAADARLALEKFKAPRFITRAQQEILRDRLKPFTGASIDILRFGDSMEIVNFSAQLDAPLTNAGWSPRYWTITAGGAVVGAFVVTKNGSSEITDKAATALVKALREVGIGSEKVPPPDGWGDWTAPPGIAHGPSWVKEQIAPIRMVIGAKP